MSFTNDISIHPVDDKNVALDATLVYVSKKYIIRIYKGFQFDGGSIPRICWTALGITPFDPRCVASFCLHDWLYSAETRRRKTCDKIFYESLRDKKRIDWLRCNLMYCAVRIFGEAIWKKHTEESIAKARYFGEIERWK